MQGTGLRANEALTFDDVLLVPALSTVLPAEVDLKTRLTKRIELSLPLVSAATDTVTGARLAIALAQEGGIGVVHKNMSVEAQAREVQRVKKYEAGIIRDPITIDPGATVGDLLKLTSEHGISGVPVTRGSELLGIVTRRDVRFEKSLAKKVRDAMTPKDRLVTALESASTSHIRNLLHRHRIEKVLIVNDDFELRGMITVKDMEKSEMFPHACKDEHGRLRVCAGIGTSEDTGERVAALVDAGVDALVLDTAHGHSMRVLDRLSLVKQSYPNLDVVAGNVATAEGARALIDAGADGVKVGIGPGSICTTRVVTGVGVPQVTAIANATGEADSNDVPVIADGGIRYSGDIAKAVAAGASAAMVGGLLAGTEEAPGETELYQGRTYKAYRGMGSLGAMAQAQGSSDRYFQDAEDVPGKLVPEGIEGRVPYKGPAAPIIRQLAGGIRSAMGYTGCDGIDAMRGKATFVRVTSASLAEGHVHDVSITKEAPNYPVR